MAISTIIDGLMFFGAVFILFVILAWATRPSTTRAPIHPSGGPVGDTYEINGHRVVRIAREEHAGPGMPYEETLGYKCKDCFLQKSRKRAFFHEKCLDKES